MKIHRKASSPISVAMIAAAVLLLGLFVIYLDSAARGGESSSKAPADGDVMAGWRVFYEKQCVACHAIWDHGGDVGPDLGRIRSGRLSGGQLAGIMWNHIPKMIARRKQAGYPQVTLTTAEMGDIFALIYFVGELDEPGNPDLGERILRDKGCVSCHALDTPEGRVGPDLAAWAGYANPVTWAQMMWEHAPKMEEAMREMGMRWPELEGDDLVHIVAFLRSLGVSGEKTYLRPGSPDEGKRLFHEKRCDSCHPGSGPDLAEVRLPQSIGALAARMWNHAPTMTRIMIEQDVDRQEITAQELADILAYISTLGRQDRGGDAERGKSVFHAKGCANCHTATASGGDGPSLEDLKRHASAVEMATSMWNHGESMLEMMTEAGISWPMFVDEEMPDLLAYLKSIQ